MSRSNIESIYPLSPMQQGMLFHTLYAPRSGAYVYQLSCRLYEPLNVPAFQQAWQQVVDRHSVLRTSFIWNRNEKPLQVVHKKLSLNWRQLDWRGMQPAAQEQELAAFLSADREQGFDLARPPLLRQTLIRVSEQAYYFVSSRPQLIQDGWSGPLILQEVFAYYEALTQGHDLRLERPRPFRDYINWLQRQDLSQAEAFWRKTLAGFSSPTPLPTAVPRTDGTDQYGYAEENLQLSSDVTERLQRFARRHKLTLNTLVQGAWGLFLARHCGERDVVFGVVVSGRPAELVGSENMVGLFINTLPMRVRLNGAVEAAEWLKRLQEEQVAARQYEYTPLVEVQGWSEVKRGVNLFETLLVYENYPANTSSSRNRNLNLQIEDVHSVEQTNYPLTLMAAAGTQLCFRAIYDRSRFDVVQIRHILARVENVLEELVADPRRKLAGISLMSESERYQILVQWNQTTREYPQKCLQELFEAQVERTPAAVAVTDGRQQLSYRELNRRANQLAHYLRRHGVGAEVLVGICVERSVEMVVGIVGVLKSGGAYVPLDAEYPRDRLALMLDDAQVHVLLTEEKLVKTLPEHKATTVCWDSERRALELEIDVNPPSVTGPANAAYVIYTSGSTGKPKGVQIPHGALVNFLTSMSREPGLSETDKLLAVTTLSFDIAGLELYLPLIVGAQLILASRETVVDGVQLSRLITEQSVTAMQATPATWQLLLTAGWPGNPQLKILCGGEALPRSLASQLRQRCASLWNMYGPTETTIWSANSRVASDEEPLTIGHPIANTEIYILNQDQEPVPAGVSGELYIGGAGLARGYLNRPDLTAEKFLPHPFSDVPGARLYFTGDLARYLPDGNIEFLGRIDDQVKLRGFRIELGEIESALRQHTAVREAVTAVCEDIPGEKQLAAYLVFKEGCNISGAELRGYLREKLPEYMIPSVVVTLGALPLTPNGKINRKALPDAKRERSSLTPAGPDAARYAEELIGGIWAEVLRAPQVGAQDNFFDIGGHSLLATQVISRIRESLHVEVPIRTLFETHNLREFAESVELLRQEQQGISLPPIKRVSKEAELPLSFAQQRLWFLEQMSPGSTSYNVHLPVRLRGPLNIRALEQALNEVVRRHEILRTSFPSVNGVPKQVIVDAANLELQVITLNEIPENEREAEALRRAREEAGHLFDLARGPLVRVQLLQIGAKDHVLLLTMHHIISDAWSIGVLIREMAVLYESYSRNEASPLPELALQYADFAAWQREWLRGEALEKELNYWKQLLGGSPPVLDLPTDRPRPIVQSYRGARQSMVLSEDLSVALKALSRRQGATLFMALLAALQTLLHRYTGQAEILVGTPIANRTRAELEGLIGFFVNTLVMRGDFSGEPTFRELLDRVREAALGAYAHQGLPFEQLVQALQPERAASHTPLFQVMFDLQVSSPTNHESSELVLQPLENPEQKIVKFDLMLSIVDQGRELRASLDYNTDLFDDDTIKRMLGHFERLLETVSNSPDRRVSQLSLLTEAEQQLLLKSNDTRTEYPKEKCIHQLFQEQVERTPDAVAVNFGVSQLTYRELDQHANQLAHYLRKLGVGPEVLVGVLMERSVEMVVGLLGILKAGGAYIPLDPTAYPQERLEFMMEDAHVAIALVQESLRLPHSVLKHVIRLDQDWSAIAQENKAGLVDTNTSENLAYVIYTSGSTGKPKGVSITHRAVNRLVLETNYVQLDSSDRVAQASNSSFDAATFEIWGALLHGAQLVGIPREITLSPHDFAAQIHDQSVSTMFLTTALFNQIAGSAKSAFHPVRHLLFGGEAVDPHSVREVLRNDPPKRLLHVYGPTESTTFTTWHLVEDLCDDAATVPIGGPISNTTVYLLDKHLQPVPIGVTGELYIGGDGLARGYLNRPQLTAERFVPDPFSTTAGAYLYKTGDLARYLKNGEIEFLGRSDQQVKIRGFRIEMGDVETALSGHESVREAVVVMREDRTGDKRLVAYVVTQPGRALELNEVRRYLKERLPQYMLPTSVVILDRLPLTPNGKVDRKALPAPERVREEAENNLPGPRDAIELQLTRIWEDILDVKPVGVHDNFFDLGGHSLLAVALMARIENAFGIKLPLAVLFQGATVESLGVMLRGQPVSIFESSLVAIQPSGSRPPLFCVHPAGGNIVGYMELARHLDPDQPVYGLQSRGLNGEDEPLTRIETMAAHYIDEIRAVQPEGPYLLAGQSLGGILAFEMARQLDNRGENVALVALLDSSAGRDPNAPQETKEIDDAELLLGALDEPQPHLLEHLRRLEPDEQARYMLDLAHERNALPPDFGLTQFRHLFHIFKINYRAFRDYVPGFYPGRVTLFRASEELAKHPNRLTLGWERIAHDVEVHTVPGNHFNMAYVPHVRTLAEQLEICLSKAQAESARQLVKVSSLALPQNF